MATDSRNRTSTVGATGSWNPYDALLEGIRVTYSQPIVAGLFLLVSAAYGLEDLIRNRVVVDPVIAGASAISAVVVATAALGLSHRYAAVARYDGPSELTPHVRRMVWFLPMLLAVNVLIGVAIIVVAAVPALIAISTGVYYFLLTGLPLAVYVFVRLSLAYPAVTIGDMNPLEAIVYSWDEADGQLARLFVLIVAGAVVGALADLSGSLFESSVMYVLYVVVTGIATCLVQLGFVHAYLETAGAPEWAGRT